METIDEKIPTENMSPSPALGFDTQPVEDEKKLPLNLSGTRPPFPSKIKKFLIGFLITILVGTIVVLIFYPKQKRETPTDLRWTPEPLPEFSPQPIKRPSSIASDSAFLKLEEDLKSLEKDITSVDLSESKLSFPIIETKIDMAK